MAPPSEAARILTRLERFGVRLGLETTRRLLTALGEPQERFPVVIVAGTNGKGSTAALLAAMGSAAGYRTGLYTSPHLETVEERIRIGGHAVSEERLGRHLTRVMAAAEGALPDPPTYFEAVTAAAFLQFAAEGVDLAVLEVGLGGRLDSTNVTDPELSLITPIGLDHREELGDHLSQVAREKAGVMRRGRPAVAWPGSPEAATALEEVARSIGASFVQVPEVVAMEVEDRGLAGSGVLLTTARERYRLELSLAGEHQIQNLAVAVLAAEELQAMGFEALGPAAVAAGTAACRWPGRLEPVATTPERTVLLDAAHNPVGAEALERFLARLGQPYDLLFGTFADKEAEGMLPPLAAGARRVVLTAPLGARARHPRELVGMLPGFRAVVEADPARALSRALEGTGLLVVTGSLYLVGEIRGHLRRGWGVPAPAAGPLFPDLPEPGPRRPARRLTPGGERRSAAGGA